MKRIQNLFQNGRILINLLRRIGYKVRIRLLLAMKESLTGFKN